MRVRVNQMRLYQKRSADLNDIYNLHIKIEESIDFCELKILHFSLKRSSIIFLVFLFLRVQVNLMKLYKKNSADLNDIYNLHIKIEKSINFCELKKFKITPKWINIIIRFFFYHKVENNAKKIRHSM